MLRATPLRSRDASPTSALSLRITIVLPVMSSIPVGGYKIQYQYAAGLVARGHRVTVVHATTEGATARVRELTRYAAALGTQAVMGHRVIQWFALDRRVRLRVLPRLAGWMLPSADVTVLTGWQTADATRRPPPRAGRMVQVVYDYEFWKLGDEELRAQVVSALRRRDVVPLATSTVVAGMLAEVGRAPAAMVTAGIDLAAFGCDSPPSLRAPVVGFAWRDGMAKAMPVMAEACEILDRRRPDIVQACYGHALAVAPPPSVRHLGALSPAGLRHFYNLCMVFVLPSEYEGWGLPAAESMACGACLVTTANGGTEDFASDGVNALVVPHRDPVAIADAVERLVDDRELRLRLVDRAQQTVTRLGIEQAVDRLEEALRSVSSPC